MNTSAICRSILFVVIAFALSSCGGFWTIHPTEHDHLPVEKTGLVFASILIAEDWPSTVRFNLLIRPVGNPNRAAVFDHRRIGSEADIHDPAFEGQLQAIRLLPGAYEITNVGVTLGGGYVTHLISNKGPFSYQFNVEAGKATYLGSFLALPHQVTRTFGMKMNASGLTVIVDNGLPRDALLLERYGHKYERNNIVVSIMKEQDIKGSVFRRNTQ